MFGVLLIWLGEFFEETSAIAGKKEFSAHKEDVYVYGFLQIFAVLITFLLMLAFTPGSMMFSWASLPTLSIRVVFEIIQCYTAIVALKLADRSTMGVVRSGTIPLLLAVDILMGYSVSPLQFAGILALFVPILLAVKGKVVNRKGLKYVLLATVLPVITSTLYKYNISNFNSVAMEGTIVFSALLIFWSVMNIARKQNPFKYLRDPQVVVQSRSIAVASVLISVAFMYSIPSLLIAVKRASAVFWSTLSGVYIFSEKKAFAKFCVAGVMLAVMFVLI